MNVIYTAETQDEVYAVHALKGAGSRQEFADLLVEHLRTLPQDEDTPRNLDLYEWADPQTLGIWLQGAATPAGTSWSEMARLAEFGTISYEYAGKGEGDWFYTEKVFA